MSRADAERGALLDLDKDEFDFWNRAPEDVHADLQSPLHWPINLLRGKKARRLTRLEREALRREFRPVRIPANLKARAHRAAKFVDGLREPERGLLSKLTTRAIEHIRQAPTEYQLDFAVAFALRTRRNAFSDPAIQHHLNGLLSSMRLAASARDRSRAKRRWLNIIRAVPTNLRAVKEKGTPVPVERAEEKLADARRRLAPVRKKRWHTDDRHHLVQRLRDEFPRWPQRIIGKLADAVLVRHAERVYVALLEGVGSELGRGYTAVRGALAASRQQAKLERGILEGKRRYISWVSARELSLSPPARARLVAPPAL